LPELVSHDGFAAMDMDQEVRRPAVDGGESAFRTTRSPLRVDGKVLADGRGAPRLGEHTAAIDEELGLREATIGSST
jgi:CoA:oxalate CoA-transferase